VTVVVCYNVNAPAVLLTTMDVDPPAESSKRRTTRIATKKRKTDKVESDVISSSAPKKPRITKKQGRLAGLLSISLDVVFEVRTITRSLIFTFGAYGLARRFLEICNPSTCSA
jgi:hypothetical protein